MNEPDDPFNQPDRANRDWIEFLSAEGFDVWWQDQGLGLLAHIALGDATQQDLARAAWTAAFHLAPSIVGSRPLDADQNP